MDYTLLTAERRAAILASHIDQVEQEHASTAIALERYTASSLDSQAAQLRKRLAELELEHARLIQLANPVT